MTRQPQSHHCGSSPGASRTGQSAFAALACLALALLLPAVLQADEIKLGGFWITDVTVQGITEGRIIYNTAAGAEVVRPLAALEGLRLSAYPEVAAAQAALDRRDDQAALAPLSQVASTARLPWLKHWANYHRVRALDRLNQPTQAVQLYLDLVRDRADPFFLAQPPIDSVRIADAQQRADIAQRLAQVSPRGDEVEGVRKLQELIRAAPDAQTAAPVAPDSAGVPRTADQPPEPPGAQRTQPQSPTATDLVLPSDLPGNDPVTQLLRAGEFQQALQECDRLLAMRELRLAMRLYQRGIAQLRLAEQANDEHLYKDAGLSFMRVVIHFPRSSFAGPSLVEAGLAHQRFGREEVAQRLWQNARLMLDSETEPAYAARLNQLVGVDFNGNDQDTPG